MNGATPVISEKSFEINGTEILKKLHLIMKDSGVIGKDAQNKFHKYKYASEHAIKTTVKPLFVKHKVLFFLSTKNLLKNGTQVKIELVYRFVDVDSGEYVEGTFVGEGEDKGDKATWKAVTGALKYILTSNLFIPTGDDPEADSRTDKPRSKQSAATLAKQRNWIKKLIDSKKLGFELKKKPEELTLAQCNQVITKYKKTIGK